MGVEPYIIDSETEAKVYLTELLEKPEFQSMSAIEQRCAKLVKDPVIKAYFLATGAEMLERLKGRT